jgi:hypothetical protein
MVKAKIEAKMPLPGTEPSISFDFNPKDITISRSNSSTPKGSSNSGGASPRVTKTSTSPQVRLGQVVFDGARVKERCDTLFEWMTPGGSFLARMIGAGVAWATGGFLNLASRPPELNFAWGSGFDIDCTLARCQVKYIRFDESGNATRAEATITLNITPDTILDLLTNPTSGGAPGRRSHLVTAGESLPAVALHNYGEPKHWRAVAQTNGIDDPLRLRPGRHLYLPNPEELLGGR